MNNKWMIGRSIKRIIDATSGYWVYKTSQLPIGTDLSVDIQRKLGLNTISTIFDVGANVGQSYRTFRRHFPTSYIHCFEPVRSTFDLLQRAVAGDINVRAEQLAFGAAPGEKVIRLFENAPGLNSLREDLRSKHSEAAREVVKIETIDRYRAEHGIGAIDLLKIDTEGFELDVLVGAQDALSEGAVATVLAEVGFDDRNGRNSGVAAVIQFLASYNYRFFGLYDVTHDLEFGIAFANALFVRGDILYPS